MASKFMMRGILKRSNGVKDGYGTTAPPTDIINQAIKCYVYVKRPFNVQDGGKVVSVEEIRGLFYHDADIKAGDMLQNVTDRAGAVLFAEPLFINMVSPRFTGPKVSHQEAILKRTR